MAKTKRKLPVWAKILIIILVTLFFALIIFIAIDTSCNLNYWKLYDDNQHIERVAKRVEKRFMNGDYEYTDYAVYPLYNQNDEADCWLVEFEPYGFLYVTLKKNASVVLHCLGYNSMYMCNRYKLNKVWGRFKYWDNQTAEYPQSNWLRNNPQSEWCYEVDENGQFIEYKVSCFKAANIQNEKMYMLNVSDDGSYTARIPAVRRGDKWLNLLSLEEFTLDDLADTDKYPSLFISSMPKPGFVL